MAGRVDRPAPSGDVLRRRNVGRWRVAAGSLVPLLPAALLLAVDVGESSSVVLLVAAVVVASILGGTTAGIAAVVLAGFVYDLLVLPPRYSLAFPLSGLPHLVGFLAVAAGTVVVVGRLQVVSRQAERARTAAEDRARELAERIELVGPVLDAAPVGFALADPDLRYRRVNPAFREICGPPGVDLVGRPVEDAGLPADLRELCRRTLDAELPVADTELTLDEPEGGTRHLIVSCFPARLETGTVVGVALMLADVTERRRLVQLEAEAHRLRATAELSFKLDEAQRLAGFVCWDLEVETGEVHWSGPTHEVLGVDRPAGRLAEAGVTVHPEDEDRVDEARRALVEDDQPFHLEHRLVRPDGTVVDVVSAGEVIRDEHGGRVRYWGTVQDVTGLRSAERTARAALHRVEQTRSQFEAEHQALQMFQRAMLPADLPAVPGAEVAAVYLPVAERIDIGGDWYDAFVLPDGRLALAVGDVTGHDLRAATVMGQVRNAVRAYASEDPAPGDVLRRTNMLLSRMPDLDLVTMLYGVYDPIAHELVWSNAGHPPPLVRHGGRATALTDPGGLLLGVLADAERYPEYRLNLDAGDAILWYTDGLIDQRDSDPVLALERLTGYFAATAGAADAGGVVSTVSRQMLADGGQEDDICLLALRRAGPPEPAGKARPAADRVRYRTPSQRRAGRTDAASSAATPAGS
jgi:PAS domain S-box-containing protein